MQVLDLGLAEIAIASAAMFAASVLHGSLGFGLGLIAAPVLILVDPRLIPGAFLCMGAVVAALLFWRDRSAVDGRGAVLAILGRGAGTVLGALALLLLTQRGLAALFVVALLAAAGLSAAGLRIDPTSGVVLGAGVASGFMGTSVGIGGPPIALAYQRSSGAEIRSSLAAIQAIGSVISIAALALIGRLGPTELGLAALLMPAPLLGLWLSSRIAPHLNREFIRPAVLLFAVAAAVSIFIRLVL